MENGIKWIAFSLSYPSEGDHGITLIRHLTFHSHVMANRFCKASCLTFCWLGWSVGFYSYFSASFILQRIYRHYNRCRRIYLTSDFTIRWISTCSRHDFLSFLWRINLLLPNDEVVDNRHQQQWICSSPTIRNENILHI